MSFQITAAPSTRVTKAYSNRRPAQKPSPLSPHTKARGKSSASPLRPRSAQSKPTAAAAADDLDNDDEDELFSSRLEDHGLVVALAEDLNLRDVPQQMRYSRAHMFDDLPQAGGFNSRRIAEVLNFRRRLCPVVSVAHVHALSKSPTATDREISELLSKGVLRRITIPGRGIGRSSIGELLVLTDDWISHAEQILQDQPQARLKYVEALRRDPGSVSVPPGLFTVEETTALTRLGLLTLASDASSAVSNAITFGADPTSTGTLASLSSAGSRAAAGSLNAVGGAGAFHNAGGGGRGVGVGSNKAVVESGVKMNLALPSVGIYLRLLEAARNYLIFLLSKSPFKEAPKYLLRERFDGAVAGTEKQPGARRAQNTVMPAKTKKWKQLYGLKFQWVLEECKGTGLVEVFETGSVGQGVRLL